MQLQLEQVRLKPCRWEETRSIPAERLESPEVSELSEVVWSGEISYAAPGFRLSGRIAYEQTVSCMRCLKPVVEAVENEVELIIFLEKADTSPGEHELGASDLGVMFLDSEVLELDDVLFEQLELNVPMSTVCRQDCLGLCPVCGADRNLQECECDRSDTDPRWAQLKQIKDDLQ